MPRLNTCSRRFMRSIVPELKQAHHRAAESAMIATPQELIALYRTMLRIRRVEEALADCYAEQQMRCPMHLCISYRCCSYVRTTTSRCTPRSENVSQLDPFMRWRRRMAGAPGPATVTTLKPCR